MTDTQQQTAEEYALKQFIEPAEATAAPLLDIPPDGVAGEITCSIQSQSAYDEAGLAFATLKTAKKELEAYFKTAPDPKDKRPGVGLCYFTRQANLAANSLFNRFDSRLDEQIGALKDGINDFDARKQAEIDRKRRAEEEQRRKAEEEERRAREEQERREAAARKAREDAANANSERERRKAQEEARKQQEKAAAAQREADEAAARRREQEDRQALLARRSETISKGPTGVIKQTNWEPVVLDKIAFLKWVMRTENWMLVDIAMGRLKKHVNALGGQNLPDGIRADRNDIVKRGR